MRTNNKAFTLIELLVVVLIIGVLAAVALPQYQKAVEKSHIVAALPILDALKKSMDIYLLEKGYPMPQTIGHSIESSVDFLCFDDVSCHRIEQPSIEVREMLDCSDFSIGLCKDRAFLYEAFCNKTGCCISAYRSRKAYDSDGDYILFLRILASTNQWEYECQYYDDSGQRACSTLQGQGNWQIVDENE